MDDLMNDLGLDSDESEEDLDDDDIDLRWVDSTRNTLLLGPLVCLWNDLLLSSNQAY
jgi:hypothetical protein